jgi:hypothetical protein
MSNEVIYVSNVKLVKIVCMQDFHKIVSPPSVNICSLVV